MPAERRSIGYQCLGRIAILPNLSPFLPPLLNATQRGPLLLPPLPASLRHCTMHHDLNTQTNNSLAAA